MKKVLLLGDSISIGYRERVKELLRDRAEVVYPGENGRFAKYTLWGVNLWIRELGKPDIVHWNNGLWDVHHESPMTEALTPPEEYLTHLARIIAEIRRTDAAVVWASTTPVALSAIGRTNQEIDRYNQAAEALMKEHRIPVNDLNSLIKTDLKRYICEDMLHLSPAGYEAAAAAVAEHIGKLL